MKVIRTNYAEYRKLAGHISSDTDVVEIHIDYDEYKYMKSRMEKYMNEMIVLCRGTDARIKLCITD
nr:MAG TPA: hypothetical protein [Caudoviricetes sp.]